MRFYEAYKCTRFRSARTVLGIWLLTNRIAACTRYSQPIAISIRFSLLQTSGIHLGGSGDPRGLSIKTRDPCVTITILGHRLRLCKSGINHIEIKCRNGQRNKSRPECCLADSHQIRIHLWT